MSIEDYARFANLRYEDFRERAQDPSLSPYEKVGFPDSYRKGKEEAILADICRKLPALNASGCTVLDIGPGCSDLPRMIMRLCAERDHRLIMVDSPEMLAQLPVGPGVNRVQGRFPDCSDALKHYVARVDAIIVYSVLHHVFLDGNVWAFVDEALALLAPGGRLLLGDIPNLSKRRRFFSSDSGVHFHQQFTGTQEVPSVEFNRIEAGQIDDAVVLSLVGRARAQGFDAYVLPQPSELPMANRREDLLVMKP